MTYLRPDGTIRLRPNDPTDEALRTLGGLAIEHGANLMHTARWCGFEWPPAPPENIVSEGAAGLSGVLFGEGTRDGWGLAQLCGWHCIHVRDSRRQQIVGLPDWICIRECVIWIELKRQRDILRADQVAMAARLLAAGQFYYLVRPSDWHQIGAVFINGPRKEG